MKHKITFIVMLYLCLLGVCSQEVLYKVEKNTEYNLKGSEYVMPKGEHIKWEKNYFFVNYNSFSDNLQLYIQGNYNETLIGMYANELKFSNNKQLFNDSFYHFIPVYYLDFIKSKNINKIYQNQPNWSFFEKNNMYEEGGNFLSAFRPESLYLGNLCLYFTINNYYIITDIDSSEIIKIYLHRNQYDIFGNECHFNYEQPYPEQYMKYKNDNDIILLLDFDGDYVDIWINSKKDYLGRYYAVPKTTLDEIHYIVSGEQKHNPENIYWPRHADGTSDFDKKVIPPMVKLVNSERQEVIKKSPSSTNVSPNKIMSVSENLKLRSGEATSTQVLTVMSVGTKVKILELGKAETIDGISSNWVKVEVQQGAKDRDGKPIKGGTVGWCFGGYLE